MKKEKTKIPKPFLKWVGGKTQLLPELMARLPHDFASTVKVYAEPFVGGGALLFHLISKGLRPERIVINDSNPELANVWRVVQRYSDILVEKLARLEADYLALAGEDATKKFRTTSTMSSCATLPKANRCVMFGNCLLSISGKRPLGNIPRKSRFLF